MANKKEKFLKKLEEQFDLTLKYDKKDSFNRHRNIIYTEIPKGQETQAISAISNSKEVKRIEKHLSNKCWIFLN